MLFGGKTIVFLLLFAALLLVGACVGNSETSVPPTPAFAPAEEGAENKESPAGDDASAAEVKAVIRLRKLEARAEELMREGRALYDRGRYEDALNKYREAEKVLEQRKRLGGTPSEAP